VLKIILTAAAILIGSLVILAAILLRDPTPHFADRRSELMRVDERPPRQEGAYVIQEARVTARSGLAFDILVSRPVADSGRRLPLALLLGGHYTGANAARVLGEHPGVVVAAMSYPYDGDLRPSTLTFLKQIPAIRRAFLDTPPALMLALDYLSARPDVDSTRMEAVGVSLGAPFVVIAGALDERLGRVWAVHGSGGSFAPLEVSMRGAIPSKALRLAAAGVASVILNGPRMDPTRWVSRIAARPFVMVNATGDERLPRAAVDELYRSARDPKAIVWMSGGHVHADAPTIQRLVQIVLPHVRSGEAVVSRSESGA
jgi:dienelactone hydrolase